MWLSDARRLRFLAAACMLVPLAACGFRPLYGNGSGSARALSNVSIGPIADRQGQILRNELLDRITPGGSVASAPYVLTVEYRENLSQLAIRRDDTATRANLRVSTQFKLREVSTGVVVYNGRSTATASYNLVQSDYANLVSRRAAQRRAAKLVADDMTTQIAIYFNRLRELRQQKRGK